MKLTRALIASSAFIILLVLIYYLHISLFKVDVVFYSSIFDVVLSSGIATLGLLTLGYFSKFNSFEKTQLIVIWMLSGYILAISVPTVIDRSLSFYILEKIQQYNGGIKQADFEELFTKGYAKEHRLVDVRLTEQLASGTVTIENGCVKLTARGEDLASFSRFFRQHLLPKQRLLMGKYSDVLTDPFRDDEKNSAYKCN
jgi:capsule polysaccharide export protein KpsE/RkpR